VRTPQARDWIWVVAALVVVLAYGVGRVFWSPGVSTGFGRVPFDWPHDVFVFLTLGGIPAAAAGLLLSSPRVRRRRVGFALVTATAAGLAGMAFFWSFAGFCLDAGEDTCIVARPAHVAHLLSPLAALAVGWCVMRWRQRHIQDPVTCVAM
jgi:ABC-type branched-subunit amino acid transport system permease subunit